MATTDLSKARRKVQLGQLTDKQKLFVNEYPIDFNGCRAVRAAGYKGNASANLARLMKNVLVQRALASKVKQRLDEVDMTAERVLQELAYRLFLDPAVFYDSMGNVITDLRKIPERARRCIDSIDIDYDKEGNPSKVKYKLMGKQGALELAMKHFGLLAPQQMEHTFVPDWGTLYGRDPEAVQEIEVKFVENSEE